MLIYVFKVILFLRLKLYVLYELLGIDESGGLPLIQFWTKCTPRSTSPRIQINTSTTVSPSTQLKTGITVSPCTQQCTSTTVSPGSEKSTRTTTSGIQPIYCVTVLTSPGNKKYLLKGRGLSPPPPQNPGPRICFNDVICKFKVFCDIFI